LARTPGCAGLVEAPGSSLETAVKEVVMIEISISRELAAEHPGFLMGCDERGHRIQVIGAAHAPPESDAAEARDLDGRPMRPTSASPSLARRASSARSGRPMPSEEEVTPWFE
jgi:hypothetical protein